MTPRPRRRGFTLVEMACVAVLTGLLGILLATTWAAFGLPAVESYRRGRIAREAMLAAASLAADLGGSLPSTVGAVGGRDDYRLIEWRSPGGDDLELWFDVPPANGTVDTLTDRKIHYYVDSSTHSLRRWDPALGTNLVVAGDVAAMAIDTLHPDGVGAGDQLEVILTFQHREFLRVHTFIARKP